MKIMGIDTHCNSFVLSYRAVAMRFEVVQLQLGVMLPKAVA